MITSELFRLVTRVHLYICILHHYLLMYGNSWVPANGEKGNGVLTTYLIRGGYIGSKVGEWDFVFFWNQEIFWPHATCNNWIHQHLQIKQGYSLLYIFAAFILFKTTCHSYNNKLQVYHTQNTHEIHSYEFQFK